MGTLIKVQELKENKNQLISFINFAWEIYQHDSHWVPPLRNDLLKTLLGRDITQKIHCGPHAFLMVHENEKYLGRMLVGINKKKNQRRNQNTGYFGFLEMVDSYEVFRYLMDYAVNWLQKHKINSIVGPICPDDDIEGRGLLIKGFNSAPVLMNSYNPFYYKKIIDQYGLEKHTDFYAYYCDKLALLKARVEKVTHFARQKYNFRIDKINLKKPDQEIKDIVEIMNAIVAYDREEDNGFEFANPPTVEELTLEVKRFMPFIDQEMIYIARSEGMPIGFVFAFPDYNPILRKMDGKLYPFGIFKFLWFKNKLEGIRGFAQFVSPKFRNKAVNAAIFDKLLGVAIEKKYKYIEGSLISENNLKSRRIFENNGLKPYKVYRVYQKSFA